MSPGSPYTRKLLAYVRYRRIAYKFIQGNTSTDGLLPYAAPDFPILPPPKLGLAPTCWFRDPVTRALEPMTDSTPIIRRLENSIAARHVLPTSPAMACLDAILEDFADEWITKAVMHFRVRVTCVYMFFGIVRVV